MLASGQGDEAMPSNGKSPQKRSSDIEITACCRCRLGADLCRRIECWRRRVAEFSLEQLFRKTWEVGSIRGWLEGTRRRGFRRRDQIGLPPDSICCRMTILRSADFTDSLRSANLAV